MNPFDHIKQFRRNQVIRRAFGTTHPREVTLPGSSRVLCVNPHDQRVRKVLLYDPLRGRVKTNQAWWRTAVAAFGPTIAVDVGLNYGECLLGTEYPAVCRCHGFEANVDLRPYLETSLAGHPHADRITVQMAAVTEEAGRTVSFIVDEDWSGRSHLAGNGDHSAERTVRTTTLDLAVPTPTADDRVLFKIDVEGFEPAVLRGGLNILCGEAPSLGFVEFDPAVLRDRGFDVAGYWAELAQRFTIYRCTRTGEATRIDAADWHDAAARVDADHCDLVLTSGDCEEHAVALAAWRERGVAAAA